MAYCQDAGWWNSFTKLSHNIHHLRLQKESPCSSNPHFFLINTLQLIRSQDAVRYGSRYGSFHLVSPSFTRTAIHRSLSVLRAALHCLLSSSEAIPTLSSIISQPPPSHSHSFALFLGPLRPCLSLAPVKSSHYSWMRGRLSWHSSAPTCTGSLTQRP